MKRSRGFSIGKCEQNNDIQLLMDKKKKKEHQTHFE